MEARMLSLFDDEDFLPQEKTKPVKPKKSLAKKEDVKPETEEENEDHKLPETVAATEAPVAGFTPEVTAPIPEAELPEMIVAEESVTAEEAATTVTEAAAIETEEEIIAPDTTTAQPEESLIHEAIAATKAPEPAAEEQSTVPATEVPPTFPSPEDDELNKQIISEIMLSDYSAFIHKDYPFDLKTVEVVKKDKEIKVTEPVKAAPAREADTEEDETDEEPAAPLPEWNLDKRYYTIGEVSQLFKVNTSHIRFWTNEFKLRPRTTRKGDRLYSPEDIAQLRLIHHLVKEKKHTIKGAKEKLKAEKGAVGNKLDLKESLVSLKEMLVQIREQL